MKYNLRLALVILASIVVVSCVNASTNTLVGSWSRQTGTIGEFLTFEEDGNFITISIDSSNNSTDVMPDHGESKILYEIVDEVDPHQLYLVLTGQKRSERIPFGIYKIENGKLIIRSVNEIHRSLGRFDMGVVRYEIPTDFNGVLSVYQRMDP